MLLGDGVFKKRKNPLDMKQCSKCKELKDSSAFGKRKDALDSQCKNCRKEYYLNNKDKLLEYQKNYDATHRHENARYKRKRRQHDDLFRLQDNLSSLMRKSLKHHKNKSKTISILGCSIEEFKKHIESQFKENMNWDNYGDWELDHIQPSASAKTKEELLKLNHYSNFQPLWKSENRSKSAKWEEGKL